MTARAALLSGAGAIAAAGMLAAAAGALAIACGERRLVTTETRVEIADLPPALAGLRMLQLSDLHDTRFGDEDRDLIAAVTAARPDLIALTGDILDRGTADLDPLLSLAARLQGIAPCFAAPGNHEGGTPFGAPLLRRLEEAGVRVLRDATAELRMRGHVLHIAGVDDPRLHGGSPSRPFSPPRDAVLMDGSLERARLPRRQDGGPAHADGPTVLLAHRPELGRSYHGRGIDLVLAGHAHGGQWRLPGIGGLYAPGQGLLPRLTAGSHRDGRTTLVISRGLKVRRLLPRLGNPPEIVVAVLAPRRRSHPS